MVSEASDAIGADMQGGEHSMVADQAVLTGAEFVEWVRPSLVAMRRVALRLAPRADVDDVVQECLLRAWRKRAQFDSDRGSRSAWLVAITVDQARAARVRGVRWRRMVDESAGVPDLAGAPTTFVGDLDLHRAVAGLPLRQRTAVELHYFVGLTVVDTASAMGCSEGTVKSTLFDARKRLGKVLESDDA